MYSRLPGGENTVFDIEISVAVTGNPKDKRNCDIDKFMDLVFGESYKKNVSRSAEMKLHGVSIKLKEKTIYPCINPKKGPAGLSFCIVKPFSLDQRMVHVTESKEFFNNIKHVTAAHPKQTAVFYDKDAKLNPEAFVRNCFADVLMDVLVPKAIEKKAHLSKKA